MKVPHGWWHLVINLDDVNMAITHNYVAKSNLSSTLRFFSEKRDQVSGCRDRPEAIKPECLYEEFVAVLKQKHPEWLREAVNERDWTCAAWSRAPTEAKTKPAETNSKSCIMSKATPEEKSSFTFSFL